MLLHRFSRLFKADVHAVIDQLEDPTVLLKQSLREMESELAQNRIELKTLQHQHSQLQQRETQLQHSIAQINDELDLCFDADNEALAKVLVKRKLEAEKLRQALSTKRAQLSEEIDAKETLIAEREMLFESVEQKFEALSEEPHPNNNHAGLPTISTADIEIAFLKEKQARQN